MDILLCLMATLLTLGVGDAWLELVLFVDEERLTADRSHSYPGSHSSRLAHLNDSRVDCYLFSSFPTLFHADLFFFVFLSLLFPLPLSSLSLSPFSLLPSVPLPSSGPAAFPWLAADSGSRRSSAGSCNRPRRLAPLDQRRRQR